MEGGNGSDSSLVSVCVVVGRVEKLWFCVFSCSLLTCLNPCFPPHPHMSVSLNNYNPTLLCVNIPLVFPFYLVYYSNHHNYKLFHSHSQNLDNCMIILSKKSYIFRLCLISTNKLLVCGTRHISHIHRRLDQFSNVNYRCFFFKWLGISCIIILLNEMRHLIYCV